MQRRPPRGLTSHGPLGSMRELLRRVKQEVFTNLKILLGLAQVRRPLPLSLSPSLPLSLIGLAQVRRAPPAMKIKTRL